MVLPQCQLCYCSECVLIWVLGILHVQLLLLKSQLKWCLMFTRKNVLPVFSSAVIWNMTTPLCYFRFLSTSLCFLLRETRNCVTPPSLLLKTGTIISHAKEEALVGELVFFCITAKLCILLCMKIRIITMVTLKWEDSMQGVSWCIFLVLRNLAY